MPNINTVRLSVEQYKFLHDLVPSDSGFGVHGMVDLMKARDLHLPDPANENEWESRFCPPPPGGLIEQIKTAIVVAVIGFFLIRVLTAYLKKG